MNVLFVCTGNTCRSPMAEYILKDQLKKRGIKTISVFSAGLFVPAEEPANPKAVKALAELDIDLSGHRARQLTEEILKQQTLLFTMTHQQAEALQSVCAPYNITVSPLSEQDISDPFGADEETYRACRDEIISSINQQLKDGLLHDYL